MYMHSNISEIYRGERDLERKKREHVIERQKVGQRERRDLERVSQGEGGWPVWWHGWPGAAGDHGLPWPQPQREWESR